MKIDDGYLIGRLKRLLDIPSPTTFTDAVARDCAEEIERLGLEAELTRRGALRVRIPGQSHEQARAVVAHIDTLGAQVRALKDNGRLELVPIGHWSSRFAEGARCAVMAEGGVYRGTILPLKASGHTYNDEIDTQPTGWPYVELRLDEKVFSRADLENLGVEIGDIVAIDPQPEFMDSGFIVSRHLDDKAGAASMFAAIEALVRSGAKPAVDTYFIFTITEEVGHGAAAVLAPNITSMVSIDNGTTAPGQNSSEFGVTIAMADQTGPFDWHLTRKLVRLCQGGGIGYQKDVFRYYRSDSASALEAGADIRTALITFGIDASHGYERIHLDALTSLAKLVVAYVMSPVEIARDSEELAGLEGFTHQLDSDETEAGARN